MNLFQPANFIEIFEFITSKLWSILPHTSSIVFYGKLIRSCLGSDAASNDEIFKNTWALSYCQTPVQSDSPVQVSRTRSGHENDCANPTPPNIPPQKLNGEDQETQIKIY